MGPRARRRSATAVIGFALIVAGAGTSARADAPGTPTATPSPSTARTPTPSPSVPRPPSPAPAPLFAGQDVSWPQCTIAQGGYAQPMPSPTARFVIIGLSRGRAFVPNPCLADQVAWVKARHLRAAAYTFPTYPTNAEYAAWGARGPYSTATVEGRLMNVGYAQARDALLTKWIGGLSSPFVWIDVETRVNHPWSPRIDRNLPLIRGMIAGMRRSGYRTGIYTNASSWKIITGGAVLGLPEWGTVGPRGAAAARAACAHPGQQGPVLIAQFWTSTADYDLVCPAVRTAQLGTYFRSY